MDSQILLEAGLALLTLTAMEIVLGIDNIIFITILAGKLPAQERAKARQIGLIGAMVMRIGLLFVLSALTKLDKTTLFNLFGHDFTVRDLVLVLGGLFLVAKATHEIHDKLEGGSLEDRSKRQPSSLSMVVAQIMAMDLVFSIDSVITAVGMVDQKEGQPAWLAMSIMCSAIIIAVGVMMFSARAIGEFVERHPTLKMLALAFLVLIGVMLTAEGFGTHVNKGYIYSAMAFSVFVEVLNMWAKKKSKPVALHEPHVADVPPKG